MYAACRYFSQNKSRIWFMLFDCKDSTIQLNISPASVEIAMNLASEKSDRSNHVTGNVSGGIGVVSADG